MDQTSTRAAIKTVLFPVHDLDAAKAVYTRLLGDPVVDQPYYVHFQCGALEIGLDPNGHAKGMTGPVAFWPVDDIAAELEALVGAGATVRQAPQEVGGGRTVATLADPDGNPIGLMQG